MNGFRWYLVLFGLLFWGLYLGELSIVARVIAIGLWQLLQVGLGGPGLGHEFVLCALLK